MAEELGAWQWRSGDTSYNLDLLSALCSCRLNGSLPKGVEAQNRTLFFRGPLSYSVAGTYICEATNPIGTRSGQVEVNITGTAALGTQPHPHRMPRTSCPVVLSSGGGLALLYYFLC